MKKLLEVQNTRKKNYFVLLFVKLPENNYKDIQVKKKMKKIIKVAYRLRSYRSIAVTRGHYIEKISFIHN